MVDNAFTWAKSKGLLRVNPVHGEEEARLVLNESFEIVDEVGTTTELSGSFEAEDEDGFLMHSDIPEFSASDEVIAAEGTKASSAADSAAALGQSASFKIVFPAVTPDTAAVSILGNFVEVLGRKIDQCEDAMDPAFHEKLDPDSSRAAAILGSLLATMHDMKKNYTYLTNLQAEAITTATDEQLCPNRKFDQNLLKTYAAITRQDVLLANYIIRAKAIKGKTGSSHPGSSRGGKPTSGKSKSPKEKESKTKTKKEPKSKDAKSKKEPKSKDAKSNKEKKSVLDEAEAATKHEDRWESSDSDCDDLAEELFVGFEQGADSAKRVARLAQVAHNAFRKHGIVDPVLGSLAKCARSKKNECRNLHRHIHATGRTFPVEISGVPTPVRVLSGKPRNTTVSYPVLFLSSWCRECFKDGGNMLLGGYSLSEDEHRDLFEVLVWTLDVCNLHWRILYANGLWLSREDAVMACEEGYQQLASMTAKCRWVLLDMEHQLEAGAEFILSPLCPSAEISFNIVYGSTMPTTLSLTLN
ncbi:unnamed protein product [Symbiodinium microadriaticum]|nr:unnamed protein product [Symbiodinium microadriaticum]